MNKFAKMLLVVSSLAPILGAYAVNAVSRQQFTNAGWFATIGLLFTILCLLLIHSCQIHLSREPLKVAKVTTSDKKTLTFLIVYLLPLLTTDVIDFNGDYLTTVYVFTIIGIAVYHTNAFTFNPVLALRGYHFYEVETQTGMCYLLMTKRIIRAQENEFTVVAVSDYVFLDTE